jgi:amino acid adenylation domain-containing protein
MPRIVDIYPLSPIQQGILFHCLLNPESGVYIVQTSCALHPRPDVSAFERAWNEVVMRHDTLRTAFEWQELDDAVQVVYDHAEISITQLDWRGQSPAEQRRRLQEFLIAERSRDFDLSAPPLMRLTLITLDDESSQFIWTIHHLLIDTWSEALLFAEISAFYNTFCQGKSIHADPAPSYRDYIKWIQQQDLSESDSFWRRLLQGFQSPTPIGTNRTFCSQTEHIYESQQITLPVETTSALQQLARQHELTLNTFTQGTWALLLSHYSQENDIAFGVTVSGRPFSLPRAEYIIGPFLNTLPMRVRLHPNAMLVDWLRELQALSADIRQFEYSPLVRVQKLSDVRAGSELFESIYVFESAPVNPSQIDAEPGNDRLAIRDSQTVQSSNYPLSIVVTADRQLSLRVIYDSAAFALPTVARMLQHMRNLIEGMIAQPLGRIFDLPLLSEGERREFLLDWNGIKTKYPRESCIHELFEAESRRQPDAIALRCEGKQLTYAELNHKANQLARYLRRRGVGLESTVAVMLNRSIDLVVSLVAVLKAGGVYVALDPDYPQGRLSLIIDDAAVKLVITEPDFRERVPACSVQLLFLNEAWEQMATLEDHNLDSPFEANNLAYLIYTSGSTGRPKGVAVSHRAVVRLVKNTNYVELDSEEVLLLLAPITFDAATFEVWGSLLNGATLAIMPPGSFTIEELGRVLRQYQVTTLWLTAGLFHQMVSQRLEDLSSLHQLIAGGDVLSPSHVKTFLEKVAHTRLINGYGPTENTTFTCTHSIFRPASFEASVPIGRPIANSSAYVLDREMRLVPQGTWGELYAGGDGVARCYVNRPDLTAARFVPDSFSAEPGARLYRTGDVVRHLPNGDIEFGGRLDWQVKVRGFRIEPQEIEWTLCQHEAVANCVVIVRQDVQGDQHLVAYVVSHQHAVDDNDLRNYLADKLPHYMVPSTFVLLPEIPLTPNGKVDRRALMKAGPQEVAQSRNFIEPHSQTEMILAGIWTEVLGCENVGADANFFELGGHSLLAMRLISKLRESFKIDLPLRTIFAASTVAEMAHAIDTALRQNAALEMPPIHKRASEREAPLSFAQQRLWLIQQLEPESTAYNVCSAVRLRGRLNVEAVKKTLNEIVRRHEILRTTFAFSGDQLIQVVAPSVSLNLEVEDLRVLSAAEQEGEVQRVVAQEGQVVFDLCSGPLFRIRLLQLNNEHVLTICRHHIIFDAWSHEVFTNEFAALYDAFDQKQSSPLPELPIQYTDFACWERDWMRDEKAEALLDYWKRQLEGANLVLSLPVDRPPSPASSDRGKWQSFTLDKNQTKLIRALSQAERVTPYMVLLAAFKTFLYHYTGQSDFLIGTPVTNRTHSETELLIGCFLNMLVLRTDLSGNPTFRELLRRVRETVLGAYAHQEMPFDRLVEELKVGRDRTKTPLVQVVFSHVKSLRIAPKVSGLGVTPVEIEEQTGKADWLMLMVEQGDEIVSSLQYRTDLFDDKTIARAMSHFKNLFHSVLSNPDSHLDEVEMLSCEERIMLNREIDISALSRSFSF